MSENTIHSCCSLAGQVAVITGSTQGIGAGIAKKFAECGAHVVIHGRGREKGEQIAAGICSQGGKALVLTGDLRKEDDCRSLIHKTCECLGQIDILVNNAAVFPRGNIASTSTALWDEIFQINLRAPFLLCQEAVKVMKARRSGCIINIGSVNAYVGMRNLLAYSASKGGLMTFTRNLAHDLESYRIRVNQINSGWVLTEGEHQVQSVEEGKGENWLESALPTRPFGRMLHPEDIARATLFFATNELITGAVLDYEQTVVGAPVE